MIYLGLPSTSKKIRKTAKERQKEASKKRRSPNKTVKRSNISLAMAKTRAGSTKARVVRFAKKRKK